VLFGPARSNVAHRANEYGCRARELERASGILARVVEHFAESASTARRGANRMSRAQVL
jgi:acetylornithine deacetylase/succinyl-diaminopimelate desuccinylase-like protein